MIALGLEWQEEHQPLGRDPGSEESTRVEGRIHHQAATVENTVHMPRLAEQTILQGERQHHSTVPLAQ